MTVVTLRSSSSCFEESTLFASYISYPKLYLAGRDFSRVEILTVAF